jgi:hypothetical protein
MNCPGIVDEIKSHFYCHVELGGPNNKKQVLSRVNIADFSTSKLIRFDQKSPLNAKYAHRRNVLWFNQA